MVGLALRKRQVRGSSPRGSSMLPLDSGGESVGIISQASPVRVREGRPFDSRGGEI